MVEIGDLKQVLRSHEIVFFPTIEKKYFIHWKSSWHNSRNFKGKLNKTRSIHRYRHLWSTLKPGPFRLQTNPLPLPLTSPKISHLKMREYSLSLKFFYSSPICKWITFSLTSLVTSVPYIHTGNLKKEKLQLFHLFVERFFSPMFKDWGNSCRWHCEIEIHEDE